MAKEAEVAYLHAYIPTRLLVMEMVPAVARAMAMVMLGISTIAVSAVMMPMMMTTITIMMMMTMMLVIVAKGVVAVIEIGNSGSDGTNRSNDISE